MPATAPPPASAATPIASAAAALTSQAAMASLATSLPSLPVAPIVSHSSGHTTMVSLASPVMTNQQLHATSIAGVSSINPQAMVQQSTAMLASPNQSSIPSVVSPVKSIPGATVNLTGAGLGGPQQHTIIRMSSPVTQGSISLPTAVAGVRPVTNIVRVRAPASTGLPAGQQIKVVGASGQTHIIKSGGGISTSVAPGMTQVVQASQGQQITMASGQQVVASSGTSMTGIAALAAAAAQQGKIVTSLPGNMAPGQTIKVVQGAPGSVIGQQGIKVAQTGLGQTAIIGGQTVRLASHQGGTLLKPGTAITGPGGKQIILQNKGAGGGQGPQIVTLVKTSQGMQVCSLYIFVKKINDKKFFYFRKVLCN